MPDLIDAISEKIDAAKMRDDAAHREWTDSLPEEQRAALAAMTCFAMLRTMLGQLDGSVRERGWTTTFYVGLDSIRIEALGRTCICSLTGNTLVVDLFGHENSRREQWSASRVHFATVRDLSLRVAKHLMGEP